MNLEFRPANPQDAGPCIRLRGKTRENSFSVEELAAIGITLESWRDGIEQGAFPGFVCLDGDLVVGMCFGDRGTGEVLVVAVLPEFEGRGVGETVLRRALEDLKKQGHTRSFLGCNPSPASRSYGFYRHLGWRATGESDAQGDEVLEIDL